MRSIVAAGLLVTCLWLPGCATPWADLANVLEDPASAVPIAEVRARIETLTDSPTRTDALAKLDDLIAHAESPEVDKYRALAVEALRVAGEEDEAERLEAASTLIVTAGAATGNPYALLGAAIAGAVLGAVARGKRAKVSASAPTHPAGPEAGAHP